MGRLAVSAMVVALFLLAGGCGKLWDIPEDNPHPPVLVAVEASPLVIGVEKRVELKVTYRDEGADIDLLHVRDKESGTSYETAPEEVDGLLLNPFAGVSGTATFFIESLKGRQAGPHTLVIWLEDSKGSWSDAVEVTITVNI
jgi:hypothetical protein